jgi:hypothetical protein
MSKIEWDQAVRYCGMNPGDHEAKRLYNKVKKNKKLSSAEISRIYKIAEQIRWVIGNDNYIIYGVGIYFDIPLIVPKKYILYSNIFSDVVIDRKGKWLVEITSDKVLGRFTEKGLEVFPNPYVLPAHLEVLLND